MSRSRRLRLVSIGLLSAIAGQAAAREVPTGALRVSGAVTIVSDYRFRGLSRSGGGPAVQGTVTLDHASGAYAGAWASSLARDPRRGAAELDLYAGYSRELLPGLTADIGLQFYAFPDAAAPRPGLFEPYVSLATTYGPARFKAGVNYAWRQSALATAGRRESNLYLHARADVAVPGTPLTVLAQVGYQDGPQSAAAVAGAATRRSWDYALGATYTVRGRLTAGVTYVGVDAPEVRRLTDRRVIGSLSLSF